MRKNDGGPAFPIPNPMSMQNYGYPINGMTLRDYFAGQALAGFMANTRRPTTIAPDDAEWCYRIADAMLAEREKSK